MPLRKLGIGTYVNPPPILPDVETPEGYNPFHPISTATMSTTVFDVVHMFSERGISAVPILDEDGIVVNLYETVDVIVSHFTHTSYPYGGIDSTCDAVDSRSTGRLPIFGLDDLRGAQPAVARFPWRRYLHIV